MSTILPTARLKTNQDTYFVPDPEGGIYFRNHKHSFRMKGSNVYQWMEKLLPMFDGTHSMQEIIEGLPDTYQHRIYEFSSLLLQEGFVRDISKDKSHSLSETVTKHYQAQIEYLDHHVGSGAHYFEKYRQESLLVIGNGPFLTSLLSSLIESGLQKIAFFLTDKSNKTIECIKHLETEAKKIDAKIEINDITSNELQPWSKLIQPYKSILFVGKETDVEQIMNLAALCEQENKHFIPAITYHLTGIVGPIADWTSAWKRLKITEENSSKEFNQTALSILANLLSFRWFQLINEVNEPLQQRQIFLLDIQTLEGKWHSFLSHPLLQQKEKKIKLLDPTDWLTASSDHRGDSQSIFSRITSPQMGIFRFFGSGDLFQLPLSQCQVEINDPLNEKNLTPIICSGFTHLEAHQEAGLCGLELYASRMCQEIADPFQGKLTIGAGENRAHAICRAFMKHLETDKKYKPSHPQDAHLVGKQSRYLAECLTTLGMEPMICLEDDHYGFPIGWVKINDAWFHSVGFHSDSALCNALLKALHSLQNKSTIYENLTHLSTYNLNHSADSIQKTIQTITQRLKKYNKHLQVYELKLEDIISQHLSIVGLAIEEGRT